MDYLFKTFSSKLTSSKYNTIVVPKSSENSNLLKVVFFNKIFNLYYLLDTRYCSNFN